MHWLAYSIMIIADALAPNKCQAIIKHHTDLIVTTVTVDEIYNSYHTKSLGTNLGKIEIKTQKRKSSLKSKNLPNSIHLILALMC